MTIADRINAPQAIIVAVLLVLMIGMWVTAYRRQPSHRQRRNMLIQMLSILLALVGVFAAILFFIGQS